MLKRNDIRRGERLQKSISGMNTEFHSLFMYPFLTRSSNSLFYKVSPNQSLWSA